MAAREPDVQIKTRIPAADAKRLARLATANQRTLSGELRTAIDHYLASGSVPAKWRRPRRNGR